MLASIVIGNNSERLKLQRADIKQIRLDNSGESRAFARFSHRLIRKLQFGSCKY